MPFVDVVRHRTAGRENEVTTAVGLSERVADLAGELGNVTPGSGSFPKFVVFRVKAIVPQFSFTFTGVSEGGDGCWTFGREHPRDQMDASLRGICFHTEQSFL